MHSFFLGLHGDIAALVAGLHGFAVALIPPGGRGLVEAGEGWAAQHPWMAAGVVALGLVVALCGGLIWELIGLVVVAVGAVIWWLLVAAWWLFGAACWVVFTLLEGLAAAAEREEIITTVVRHGAVVARIVHYL
jgi:hypothetical protein